MAAAAQKQQRAKNEPFPKILSSTHQLNESHKRNLKQEESDFFFFGKIDEQSVKNGIFRLIQ